MSNALDLSHYGNALNVVIVGASGAIGTALAKQLLAHDNVSSLLALSRSGTDFESAKATNMCIDFKDEETIKLAAETAQANGNVHLIIVTTGVLHAEGLEPEKALRDLSLENFQKSYLPNLFGPALIAKHFLPLIPKDTPSLFTALSARVASISDNKIGGWYAYRSAKTALNMVIKNASIEVGRRFKHSCIIGLHPGTVDTPLSKPFQSMVKHDIFTPDQSADYLLNVIATRRAEDTGKVFAWDGEEIPA